MQSGVMFGKSILTLGVAALALVAGNARAEESLNVSKLNKALGRIVREVLEAHQKEPNPLFKALEFKLDDKGTILDDEDKFAAKVRLKAVASRSRWSPRVETSLGADLGFSADRVKQEATLELAAALETDTLGLFRFAAGELVVDWCKKPTKPIDAEYCAAMKKLTTVKKIDDVIATVVGLGETAVKEARANVGQAEKDLEGATPSTRPNLQKRLEIAKQDLEMATSITKELKRGALAGAATGTLRVAFRGYDAGSYGELKDVEIYLDKDRVDAKLKYTMREIRDIDSYFKMKPQVIDAMKKLEAGNAEEVEDAKRFLELYLNIAASLIEGK